MASNSKNLYCPNYSSSLPFTLSVSFRESSYNVAGNTSTLSLSASIKSGGVAFDTNYNNTLQIYWYDDNSYSKGTLVKTLNVQDLTKNSTASTSGTLTVTHKADGSLSGYAKAVWTKHSSNSSVGLVPASGDVSTSNTALTTIPRASSISSVTGTTLGSSVSVAISRASTSFTHKVEWKIGASAYVTVSSNATTSASFTPDISYASQYPNSTRCACTVRVTTYNGSTQIGEAVTSGCWLDIPANVKPTCSAISFTRIDNGVPSNWGIYVQGYSKVTASISGSGTYGSTISSYYLSGCGTTVSSGTLTTGVLANSGTYSFSASVTDSRGRTSDAKTGSITVYAYSRPSVSISAVRCTEDGTVSSSGTYLKVTCNYSYASVNGKNTITRSVYCNGASNTSFTSGTSFILNANCSISSTYTITATVTDGLGNSSTATYYIPTAERIMNVKSNGKGIAFGGFASKDNAIQCFWDLYVGENKVSVDGHTHSNYATSNHSHSNYATSNHTHSYLPLSGGTMTGTLTIQDAHLSMGGGNIYASNDIHWLGSIGLRGAWVGLYPSYSDCLNNTNRKGWYGHNGGTSLSYVNEAGGYLQLKTNGAGIGFTCSYGMLYFDGSWRPQGSNTGEFNLGESYSKWKQLYATTATIATSDRNEKKDFTEFDERYEKLFFDLKPQLFKFKNGESNRFHSGFISQDVEESLIKNDLTALDFAGFCKDKKQVGTVNEEGVEEFSDVIDENGECVYDYSLRYEEFIALNTYMIQRQQTQINEQQKQIEKLTKELEDLKTAVLNLTK